MKKALHSPIYKPIKGNFLVPSYYKDFTCKGDKCRNTCCSGWSVKISMKEYFLLHGLQCNKELRIKLDNAIKPLNTRTQDKYAEIVFGYDNKCTLLSKEGWCLLHKHYGENVLSSVCRYFPRGARINYQWEVSTSNGCERTLELLFNDNNLISYETKELQFYMPMSSERNEKDVLLYSPVRNKCIEIIQDRQFSLSQRIMKIGKLMMSLDEHKDISEIDFFVTNYEFNIEYLIKNAQMIGNWFIENTGTFSEYFNEIEQLYSGSDIASVYKSKREHFNTVFTNHEILFEKVLTNNIYYKQFPFQDYTDNFTDEFIALAGKYFILKYICIHLLNKDANLEDLIDLLTKLFRVIAHTGFEKNIMILLKRLHLNQFDILGKLLLM